MSQPEPLQPWEVKARKEEFDRWLALNGDKLGYYLLPANRQAQIRHMLLKAYYAGSNWERKREKIVEVGGYD